MIVWYVPSLIQPSPSVAAETRRLQLVSPHGSQFGPCHSASISTWRAWSTLGEQRREPRLAAAARADDGDARQSRNSPRATTTAEPPTSISVLRARDCVERRRAVDLRALVDLDLLPELGPAVPREVERDRPGGRAGRGIFGHAVRGDEDARLPRVAVARDARRAVRRERLERAEVGTKRSNGLGRSDLDDDVLRALAVELDRRDRRFDSEQREQRVGVRVRLVGERRLRHPAERDPRAVALDPHRHDSRVALEPDLHELERPGENERRPEDRMPGERQLERRREDPDPDVSLGRRRVDEHRLAELHLARERLQHLFRNLARVGEDGDLVPGERHVGEDVGNDVAEG